MLRRFFQFICILLLPAMPLQAQGLIRDAEIEATLKRIAEPLLIQAGLPVRNTQILIVNDRRMNAFVTNGSTIFVNYGLILKFENVEQLQAVLAHEIAHITAGHFGQRVSQVANARSAAGLGILLGLAAAAAGAPEAAAGVASGVQNSTLRGYFANTRDQEAAADRVSLRLMASADIRPSAAIDALQVFVEQDLRSTQQRDPYAITHPLTRDRIRAATENIAKLPKGAEPSKELVYWYERMQAKFIGFTGNPKSTLQNLRGAADTEATLYARAIAHHQNAQTDKALTLMDRLLTIAPDDPYYTEIKGQFLLESNRAQAALAYYQKALDLAPKETLISAGLGSTLLALDRPKEALATLQLAYRDDQRNGRLLRDLGRAYGALGQQGLASVAYAEHAALIGDGQTAITHARRAQKLLKRGTTGWLRAEDVLIAFRAAPA